MYKNVLEHKLVKTIGQYGIVKTKEQLCFQNGSKIGGPYVVYDVCLDNGDGDIVHSCCRLKDAIKYAKEN